MAFVKRINVNDGSGRSFEENTVAELQFDVKPEVGSFNAVTSDAVARAVAGASGEVPQVTENDNGKVLTAGYDAGGPSVSWEDAAAPYTAGEGISIDGNNVISCTLQSPTAGAGIEIDAQNAVSVNAGTGLSINSGTSVNMTLKAIKFNGEQYRSIGQLTAQAVAAIKGNASLDVTVLGDYTIEPNVYSFYDVRIAIVPGVNGGSLPDVSAAKAILSTTNIRSSFVAGSGTGRYTMSANTQVTVDFSNPTIGSSISWADVEANPTNYLLAIVGFYYGTLYESAYSNAAGGDPEQKDVATVGYTIPGDNSLEVSNPVPSTAGVPNSSVLAMGNSGMEWVEGGVPSYMDITSGTVSIARDNTIVTSTADMTSIIVGADVKSAVVQWTVASTTTLPTVTDGTNALKAAVNNPSSLTVGRTVQVSILNGTWVCAEFA